MERCSGRRMTQYRSLPSVSIVCPDGALRLPRFAPLWVRPSQSLARPLLCSSSPCPPIRRWHHHAPDASTQKARVTSGLATFHRLLGTHPTQVAQQLSRFTSLVNEMATILSASAIVG